MKSVYEVGLRVLNRNSGGGWYKLGGRVGNREERGTSGPSGVWDVQSGGVRSSTEREGLTTSG